MKSASQSLWRVSEALTGQDRSKSLFFKLRLVSALVVLPAVLFFALLMFIGIHFLLWVVSEFPLFQETAGFFDTAIYVLVTFIWALTVAVLLRPLWTIKEKPRGVKLTAKAEASMYDFTKDITASLSLENHYAIFVNMDIAVDARYLSLADFRNQKLTLSLGLPLIQTLTLEQVAALIARELSRFSHASERLSYSITRAVIAWFYRVINNEDDWQTKINAINNHDKLSWLSPLLVPISLGIGAVDGLFRGLLSFAEAVSRASLYEVEFRADVAAAKILGKENFSVLLKRLVHIDQAYHSALELVLTQSIVPQNINKLIESQAQNTAMESDHFIEMALSEHFNGAYFLPAPQQRSMRVEQIDAEKISRMQGAAKVLLSSLDSLSITLSDEIYAQYELGDKRSAQTMPAEVALPRFDLVSEEEVLRRFSSGLFRRDIVWQPPQDEKLQHLPPAKIKPFLNKVVASIRQNLPLFSEYVEILDEFNKVNTAFHFYKWLVKDGSKNRPDGQKIEAAKRAVLDFDRKYKASKENLSKSYGVRIAAAVAFGQDQKAYPSAAKLLTMLTRLSLLENVVGDSKVKARTMEQLSERIRKGDDFHQATVSRLTKMVIKSIASMEAVMSGFPASLLGANGVGDINRGKLNLDELNGANYEKAVINRFTELVSYYEAYNTAVSAKLARFVEMIEKKHGVDAVVKVNLQERKPKTARHIA